MNKRSLQFLKSLVNTPSPSGHESKGLRIWMDYVDQYADETYSDAYGNCVAVLNKGLLPRLPCLQKLMKRPTIVFGRAGSM